MAIPTLIVGIGNPLRSDDGLGWHVAQELLRELDRDDIRVIATHQLTPEIAELASRVKNAVFVDAARGGTPGTLRCEPIEPKANAGGYSHELSPAAVLDLAQRLYGWSPSAYLLTIAGESFATGDTLSGTVADAIPALKARIHELLDLNKEKSGDT